MIVNSIIAVKTALMNTLVDQTGTAIFTAISEILTGWPHTQLVQENPPTVNNPYVAVDFQGLYGHGIDYMERLTYTDADPGDGKTHRYDVYALADLGINCHIHILAATTDELVGTGSPYWTGYVEQAMVAVRLYPEILGPDDTHIVWDLSVDEPFDIPGAVTVGTYEGLLFYAVVNTVLRGKLTGVSVDGAPITELEPYDDDFTPVKP
jgi:hypothetical protein